MKPNWNLCWSRKLSASALLSASGGSALSCEHCSCENKSCNNKTNKKSFKRWIIDFSLHHRIKRVVTQDRIGIYNTELVQQRSSMRLTRSVYSKRGEKRWLVACMGKWGTSTRGSQYGKVYKPPLAESFVCGLARAMNQVTRFSRQYSNEHTLRFSCICNNNNNNKIF